MTTKLRKIGLAIAGTATLTLAGCGGGGGGSSTTPLAPTALTGKVFINLAIKNALVCMDLNANNVCDTGEPTSAMTDVAGAYSLTYDPAVVTAAQVAAAPMIAQITPGTPAAGASVDAEDPTIGVAQKPYTLSAPAGKAAQINPLTTLVQTGIRAGLTLATAEAAVALQLAIPSADIYDYQGKPAFSPSNVVDNARLMAMLTSGALDNGARLSVIDPPATASATPSNQLVRLSYTSASDFFVVTFPTTGIAATSGPTNGQIALTDTRTGKTVGALTANDVLYSQVYLTPTGWVRCDGLSAFTSTLGTPNRSGFCSGGLPTAGYTIASDISGNSMASVVTTMQAATDGSNSITMSPALLGSAVFPAGSTLNKRRNLTLSQNIFINNTNTDTGLAGGVTTLEAFIAARQTSGVNLATAGGTVNLGLISNTRALQVAFTNTTNAVQFYSCDFVAPSTVSNCTLATAGTFAISTVNGVRIIRYSGHPVTFMNHVRGHAEFGGRVAHYRQNKPDIDSNISNTQRLNGTAFDAMKALLPGL